MVEDKIVGMTTLIPIEPLISAGYIPRDLNNLFINSKDPERLIDIAEGDGIPRQFCTWVKGIYGAVKYFNVKRVIIPSQGDCSNCLSLGEILESQGIDVYYFRYPYNRNRDELISEIKKLCGYFNTDIKKSKEVFEYLREIRIKLKYLDDIAHKTLHVPGEILHSFLISASDFNGNIEDFKTKLLKAISIYEGKGRDNSIKPLALTGVPPIISNIFSIVEDFGYRFVYFESAREFSLPYFDNFIDAYLNYTYPYSLKYRIKHIKYEVNRRKVSGVIHYIQSFCHRQLECMILKKELGVPTLFLEGEDYAPITAQQLMRLESFLKIMSLNQNNL